MSRLRARRRQALASATAVVLAPANLRRIALTAFDQADALLRQGASAELMLKALFNFFSLSSFANPGLLARREP